jgi:hypothetical protein
MKIDNAIHSIRLCTIAKHFKVTTIEELEIAIQKQAQRSIWLPGSIIGLCGKTPLGPIIQEIKRAKA